MQAMPAAPGVARAKVPERYNARRDTEPAVEVFGCDFRMNCGRPKEPLPQDPDPKSMNPSAPAIGPRMPAECNVLN
jgi:hypothetical protein